MKNFDRQYRFSAGQAGQVGFEVGAESPIPLHVSFSVQKTDLQSQNTAKVSIWNLNEQHLAEINKDDCVVALKAGYGSNSPLIFTGIVTYATTEGEGADRRTDIELVDNRIEIRDTYVSLSYSGAINTKQLLEYVAGQMGVAITFSYNAEFVDLPNGYSFVGQAKKAINELCTSSGLTWSLQNGVLQVKKPGDVMSREVYLLTPETGLIGIPKRVQIANEGGTSATQHGWDISYFLNGAISVDDYVRLESRTVAGYFRVYSIDMEGDNVSGVWQCSTRLLEVKEQ